MEPLSTWTQEKIRLKLEYEFPLLKCWKCGVEFVILHPFDDGVFFDTARYHYCPSCGAPGNPDYQETPHENL
jgi:Zn finger protein HypA/HybF involved in hydrogenase expression